MYLKLASPDPVDDAVDQDEEADGDDDRGDRRAVQDRPDEGQLEHGSEHERDGEGREERLPVRKAPLDELIRDERRQHREFALREVDDVGGAVDEDERQGEASVDGAEREPLDGQLGEERAPQTPDEETDRAEDENQNDG